MPHQRLRFATTNLLKKLDYFRVVGVQGPRQCGKSYLSRELLKPHRPTLVYRTFDQPTVLDFATTHPESFLNQYLGSAPLVIDEAQKCPRIFDAVKFIVDQNQQPGQFLLLGSTEFSKKNLIRESLTGRIGLMRLYPMTCAETLQQNIGNKFPIESQSSVSRSDLLRYLNCGGMPGMCFVRSITEREEQIKSWLDTTVNRDLALIPKLKLNPDLALSVLKAIATLEEPTAGNIAKKLRRDPRTINSHLSALSMLYVIQSLSPHELSTGKPVFFLCDVAFAQYLSATFERQLQTMLLQELLAKNEYLNNGSSQISFYRTTKGSFVHFILETRNTPLTAIKILFEEKLDRRELEVLNAFGKKTDKEVRLVALAPVQEQLKVGGIDIYPWERVC